MVFPTPLRSCVPAHATYTCIVRGQLGFIHVRGLLSPELVQRCNSALDANMDALEIDEALIGEGALENTPLGGSVGYERAWTGMLSWPSPHCNPWRELLAHQGPSHSQPTFIAALPPSA